MEINGTVYAATFRRDGGRLPPGLGKCGICGVISMNWDFLSLARP
ncbi:MAG: hypothetical protein RLZZ398_560 [Verrucomicrobiota bacterium]|jgi:hypothetical protein